MSVVEGVRVGYDDYGVHAHDVDVDAGVATVHHREQRHSLFFVMRAIRTTSMGRDDSEQTMTTVEVNGASPLVAITHFISSHHLSRDSGTLAGLYSTSNRIAFRTPLHNRLL